MAIRFRTNLRKALEVILWFATKRPNIDFHAILKLLFFADMRHLNEWGRPIVGDAYNALPYGPVAQTTYDLLKREPLAVEMLQLTGELPFSIHGGFRVRAKRPPDLTKLSESDVEALESTWSELSHLNFDQLTYRSHEHPAYREAEMAGRQRMSYAAFLEGKNASPDVIAELEETAHRIRI